MNSAVALRGRKNVDAGAERETAIIAARTLSAAGDILRAVINRIRIKRMWRWRWSRRSVVRTSTEGFVIGAGWNAAALHWGPGFSVIIRVSCSAVALAAN